MVSWMIRILLILLVGVLFHFVVVTGLESVVGGVGLFRLWKEVAFVVIGIILVLKAWQTTRPRSLMIRGVVLYAIAVVWSLWVSFGVYDVSIYSYAQAFKYDFFFFVPLVVGLCLGQLGQRSAGRFFVWLRRILVGVLVLGIVWYGLVAWFPGVIASLGYDPLSRGWTAGATPPVRYLTNVRWGYIRNQGIFSGPVSWGFLLVSVGPRLLATWRGSRASDVIVAGLWMMNVVLSFSRAAWGVSVVLSVLLVMWMWWCQSSRVRGVLLGLLLGGCVAVGLVMIVGQRSIRQPSTDATMNTADAGVFQRELSDIGHQSMVSMAVDLVKANPFYGRGAASAGPASFVDKKMSIQTGLVLPEAHQWMYEQGLTVRETLEDYRPDDLLSRQMMAFMLDRMVIDDAVIEGDGCVLHDIDLVEPSQQQAVRRVCQIGLLETYDDGHFRPYKTVSYREALVALVRLVEGESIDADKAVERAMQIGLYEGDDKHIWVTPTYRKHAAVWLWLVDQYRAGEDITYPAADFAGSITGFNPENNYLQIAIEYGLVGLLLRLAVCVVVVIARWRAWARSDYRDGGVAGVGLGLLGLAAAAMVLHPFVDSQVMYVLMMLMGVVMGAAEAPSGALE